MENNCSDIWWILDKRKEQAQFSLVQMAWILECNSKIKIFQIQHDTRTSNTNSTKSSDKKSLNMNLVSLEIDIMTDEIFGMIASVKTNYHITSDETDKIFDGNAIHCTEVKNSTSDDSEPLKE